MTLRLVGDAEVRLELRQAAFDLRETRAHFRHDLRAHLDHLAQDRRVARLDDLAHLAEAV